MMPLTSTGIQAMELRMDVNGEAFVVHPTLLWDEQHVVLVDTGISGQLELIRTMLEKEGFALDNLTHVIITHQDRDHIGSLPEVVQAREGHVAVLAHEEAVPYLTGALPLIKSKVFAPSVQVHTAHQDGDILPLAGGIQVVYTPGHTPDHMSLYHIPSKTLIAGDALTSQEGILLSFDPQHTLDPSNALQSIAKLLQLDIDTVIAYHGGAVTNHVKERLQEIVHTTPVIRPCAESDEPAIFRIINDAATAYQGVIPEDRYAVPYMSLDELKQEMSNGVNFWGVEIGGQLIGVMGIQDKGDVALIRHAYVQTSSRQGGIGTRLLNHIIGFTDKPILIGTWEAASWAIAFYEKNGFALVPQEKKAELLQRYWDVPERQIETSVVLASQNFLK